MAEITNNENVKVEETKKEIVSKDKMLEAGVYFGHRTSKWNPKMKPYILMSKKGTHIIDIQKTKKTLEFAYSLIKRMSERGADFIFVGTRKQAKATVKENALRTNSFYMSERWLGGTLTNNRTIFQRVRRMFELEKLQEDNFEGYTKKEGVLFTKELVKLQKNLSGIKNMKRRPSVMIVADVQENLIAIKEAKRLGMRVIGIVDTNDDPTSVDVAIPANNDSIKSVTLITTILADAVAAGKNGSQSFAYQDDASIVLPEELKKEFKPRGRRFDNRRPNPRFQNNRRPSENTTTKTGGTVASKVEASPKVTPTKTVEESKGLKADLATASEGAK